MNIYFIFPRFRISINGSNKFGLTNVDGQFFEVKFIWKLDSVFNVHFTIASITWLTFFECGTFTPKSKIGEMNYSTTFSVKWSDSDFKVNECCIVFFPSLIQWLFMTISERIQRWKVFFEHESFYKTFSNFSFHLINSSSDLHEENEKETKDKSDMRRPQFTYQRKRSKSLYHNRYIWWIPNKIFA